MNVSPQWVHITPSLPLAYHGFLWYPMTPRTLNLVFDHKPILVFVLENGPHISGSPTRLTTLPQALFFPRKWPPYFWKPWTCGYVASGAFFFLEKWPLEFWDPTKIQKIKNLKIKIHAAQNVGKVWISRKKNFPAPFHTIPGHVFHGPETYTSIQKASIILLFSLVGQWALLSWFWVGT